jgi:protein-S-isoprenylcysteine O-methyltransferase Ste14
MRIESVSLPDEHGPGMAARVAVMHYSIASYLVGVAALVYLILFIADLFVPVSINRSAGMAPDLTGVQATLWNIGVIALWSAQHTVMARPTFKRLWTRVVPVAAERSTYLVLVAVATALLVLFWIPMPDTLWDLSGSTVGALVLSVYFLGWGIVLFSTFLINHFHLFGLQQAFQFMQRQQSKQETFRTPLLYKLVRHPMMSGVLIALWAVPVMTSGRLLFNIAMTVYVFVGLYFEERNLVDKLGDDYRRYQATTPAVIPEWPKPAGASARNPAPAKHPT